METNYLISFFIVTNVISVLNIIVNLVILKYELREFGMTYKQCLHNLFEYMYEKNIISFFMSWFMGFTLICDFIGLIMLLIYFVGGML